MFHDDLRYSHQDEMFTKFYKTMWPGLLEKIEDVEDLKRQKQGIDKVLFFKTGHTVNIDEKKRRKKWNDFLIEIWSDYDNRKPGWIHHTHTDYVAYGFEETNEIYLIPFLQLQVWFRKNEKSLERFKFIPAHNKNYTSMNIAVPWSILFAEMFSETKV